MEKLTSFVIHDEPSVGRQVRFSAVSFRILVEAFLWLSFLAFVRAVVHRSWLTARDRFLATTH
jgi:hypothetical protein